ncbi:hypothetical protein [Boseongicola sp. H5]|uniref:hypothetical protein n=1 Tax=Boseongicola sp. H5 TaxID=2763261 RepID=UPI00336A0B89
MPDKLGPTVPELADLTDAHLHKSAFSAADMIAEAIGDLKAHDFVIAGCEAHVCVLQTPSAPE